MRPRNIVLCLLVLALTIVVAAPTPAAAQNVTNPRFVEFIVSEDHANVAKYVLGYYLPGADQPVQVVDLGTGTPDATEKVTFPIDGSVKPLTFGVGYTARVKAVAKTGPESVWSEPSNAFDRVPSPPRSAPVIR